MGRLRERRHRGRHRQVRDERRSEQDLCEVKTGSRIWDEEQQGRVHRLFEAGRRGRRGQIKGRGRHLAVLGYDLKQAGSQIADSLFKVVSQRESGY